MESLSRSFAVAHLRPPVVTATRRARTRPTEPVARLDAHLAHPHRFHGMAARIRIGTQGWNYDAWVGPFYPAGTRPADFLTVYARAFDTVEVDSTFYASPVVEDGSRLGAANAGRFHLFAQAAAGDHPRAAPAQRRRSRGGVLRPRARARHKLGPILIQLGPDFGPTELAGGRAVSSEAAARHSLRDRVSPARLDSRRRARAARRAQRRAHAERRTLDSAAADDAAGHAADGRLHLCSPDGGRPEHRRLLARPARPNARNGDVGRRSSGRTPSRAGRHSCTSTTISPGIRRRRRACSSGCFGQTVVEPEQLGEQMSLF